MGRARSVFTVVLLLMAIAVVGVAMALSSPVSESEAILRYADVPWLKGILIAFAFSTIIGVLGFSNGDQKVERVVRVWGLAFFLALVVWLCPLALAPSFGWTFDGCFSFSLMACLLPTLAASVKGMLQRAGNQSPHRADF